MPKYGTAKTLDGFNDPFGASKIYVALTKFNLDFITAVVNDLDSSYKDGGKSGHLGTAKQSFDKMNVPGSNFDDCLLSAITAIDKTNSMHLNTHWDHKTGHDG